VRILFSILPCAQSITIAIAYVRGVEKSSDITLRDAAVPFPLTFPELKKTESLSSEVLPGLLGIRSITVAVACGLGADRSSGIALGIALGVASGVAPARRCCSPFPAKQKKSGIIFPDGAVPGFLRWCNPSPSLISEELIGRLFLITWCCCMCSHLLQSGQKKMNEFSDYTKVGFLLRAIDCHPYPGVYPGVDPMLLIPGVDC